MTVEIEYSDLESLVKILRDLYWKEGNTIDIKLSFQKYRHRVKLFCIDIIENGKYYSK